MWFLTAEYRVYGQIPLKESLGLALACENQRESSDAFIRQANVRISVASGGQNPIAALIGNRLSTSGYKEASLDIFGQITNPKTVSQGSLSIEVRDEGGIDLRADLGSAGRVTIPHDNGRFETDAEFIDAAVDASGKWWILRNNSLTCYKSDALMEIVDFGLFNTKVNSDAVLRFFENTLVIGTSGTYAAVVIRNAGVVSTPYQKEVTVNTDTVRDTGLQVVKDLQGARIKIGDAVYTGGRPFPFDTLDAMVATEGKIFLKTPVGIWTFTTGQSELGRGRYLPFPQTLQGPKILKACPAESAVLKVGNRLHRISSDFPELPSEDCIRPPRKVADENGWQWYFDADHQRVLFKARVGGQWKEYTRQSADGRFADDISSFMVSFDGAVHVATKMGILRFELKKGDSDQTEVSTEKTIVIEGVRELKTVEGALYALTQDSKVLKLNVKEQWEPDGGASATAIFEKATPVYSSPYLTIAAFRNRLKITAESGRSAVWDGSAKRFRMDMVQDFAVGKESLVVLNRQSKGAVRHSFEDLHRHYLPADQPLMGFETRDGNIYALTTAKTFLMDHDRSGDSPAWKPVSSNLVLAGRNGLSFRKDLLATVEDNAILPFLADKRMDAFWSQGRFAFDLITNIEGGGDSAWWTTTAAGLVTMQGLEGMQLNTLHADIPATARLKHRKGHLYIAIEEAHYHLDAEAMKIEPAPATEMTAFSRVVFDFRIDPDNRYYTWAPVEIEDREQRAVFQVLTGDAVRRSDVLAGGRFFWDQVISAAHDPEQGLYWTIGPGHLSTNRFHRVHQRPTLSPTGFFFEASALEGYDIKDTVFKDGTLYVLHTSTPAQSVGSEQPAPDSDVDDPVMNEPVELVRKRVDNQEWRHADDEEYPFWQPMVEFSLEDHIWTQKRLRYSRFHSRESNFSFTAPRDYPLFSRFGRGSEYGKFSFDYLTSIYAVDDTLWAGSRGGLVKLRCRVDNQKHALRLEQLYLPQSSLHDSVQAKPLYNVSAMRVETPQRKLHLLVQSADNSRFVQALDLPGWEKVDPLKTPKETMDLPISGGFKYHLTYDPVRDVGSIDLVGDGDETITLCHYRSFTPCENRLDVSDDGRLVFRADDDAYGFILPQGASNTISVPLSAVDMVEPRSRFQVLVTGDSIGKLEWGVVDDHTPAVRLPSGNILILTGSPGLDALKIEGSTLVWRPKSEKAGSQNIIAKHLNLKTGRLTSVDGTSDAVQWVAYTTQPGDSISQYLIDYGIVEKRNFFRKLFNRKHIELKHWIDLIAKKNKIHWGGKGDYDYPLQVGSVYMMPQKGVDLDSAYRTDIENLVIGKERFDRWGDEQRPASGLVISEIVRIGFGHGQFMVFNIDSRQAIFHPLPTQLPPLRLWQTGSRVLMSFTDGEDLELWQYFPQNLRTADSDPDNFHVIRVRNGSQVLEAHPKAGIIVDNGFDRKHVIKSSEAFFGTHMDKVVDIVEDNRGHGYWFATETSGLIWSRQPF